MTRTLIRELASKAGQTVTIQGWLHKKRLLGGLNFITLRDRSGIAQSLIDNKVELEKLRGLQTGTILSLTGIVVSDERAPGGVELHSVTITVEMRVTDESPIEIDKPISHKSENLDTLLDYRPLTLRNLHEQAIFKIQAKTLQGFREFFAQNDFIEINSPKLLAEATEGGAETFKLDYFGKTATLAQSAQFYKQMTVGVFERVFETNPTYRAEPSATTRHMTEYITVDAEIGFIDMPDLLNYAGECLRTVIRRVEEECAPELKMWNYQTIQLPHPADIPRLAITEIHDMFFGATGEDHRGEDDLAPAEEKWICEYTKNNLGSEAVFVVGWPSQSKTFKFYHRINKDDPTLADRADLLFRGIEVATLSMRENNYEQIITQLKVNGNDPDSPGYAALLSAYKYGMPPHGGWGWGLERTVEKILNLSSVKEASLFPRDINRLTP